MFDLPQTKAIFILKKKSTNINDHINSKGRKGSHNNLNRFVKFKDHL